MRTTAIHLWGVHNETLLVVGIFRHGDVVGEIPAVVGVASLTGEMLLQHIAAVQESKLSIITFPIHSPRVVVSLHHSADLVTGQAFPLCSDWEHVIFTSHDAMCDTGAEPRGKRVLPFAVCFCFRDEALRFVAELPRFEIRNVVTPSLCAAVWATIKVLGQHSTVIDKVELIIGALPVRSGSTFTLTVTRNCAMVGCADLAATQARHLGTNWSQCRVRRFRLLSETSKW